MTFLVWNILLAVIWALLTGRFDIANLLLGFSLGYGLMLLTRRAFPPTSYFAKMAQVTRFVLFFLKELMVASVQVARQVLRPRLDIHPGIVAVPLDAATDLEITLLSIVISLTPGTLTLEVAPDRHTLYVHGMDVADGQEFVRKIKAGLEARTLEVTR